jgi:hypothetical protein
MKRRVLSRPGVNSLLSFISNAFVTANKKRRIDRRWQLHEFHFFLFRL